MSKKMAVLVDGGFFIKRFSKIYGLDKARDPSFVAEALREVANKHAKYDGRPASEIYRIFFYDCPPLTKRAHYPISKRRAISALPIFLFLERTSTRSS